jgi:AAA domain, putative AbiEii toxin, Type IV TA system
MDYHIKELLLDGRFQRYSVATTSVEGTQVLSNLSKVNIFIGANNSGKSRFLRELASTEKLTYKPNCTVDFSQVEQCRKAFTKDLQNRFANLGITDAHALLASLNKIPSLSSIKEGSDSLHQAEDYFDRLATLTALSSVAFERHPTYLDNNALLAVIKSDAERQYAQLKPIVDSLECPNAFKRLYIPMLRGLRDYPEFKTERPGALDPYMHRTHTDYFPHVKPDVWTGLDMYQQIQKLLLGNLEDREVIAAFQDFIGKTFFDGQRIALIPKLGRTVLDIKIGDEAEYPIYLVGDGIQSLILLTFPLFLSRGSPLLFFCEEPEMYMHPGLQRAFLKLITSDTFAGYQYFLTTHSNHFLDLTTDFANVSVYTFQKQLESGQKKEKEAHFTIENVSNEDRRTLELLGVRNSSVLLSNCTIWVEGITDRRYYKHFLKLYQDRLTVRAVHFREDWHYAFVEYGGGCITHWSFLDGQADAINTDWVCGRLLLLADGDTATEWKNARHEKLTKALGERYYHTRCKEIENMLTPEVLTRVLQSYGENEVKQVSQKDYLREPLGMFIERQMLTNKARRGSYVQDGTISDKVNFCSKAIAAMTSYDDLSDESKDIAERLYKFIASHNK